MSANSSPIPAMPQIAIAPEPGHSWSRSSAAFRWSRSTLIALCLLLGWGAVKIRWEERIDRAGEALQYHGLTLTRSVTDQLSQGAMLAVLGGLRAVVANYFWIQMETAFENQQWYKVKSLVGLSTTLQPRSVLFWDMGSWELAWNASVSKLENIEVKSAAQRTLDSRFWIEEGRKLLQRGVENNPDSYELWYKLGFLEEQRRQDYLAAAHDYAEALKHPHTLTYLERFVGYDLERGGDLPGAYQWWRQLWLSTPDHTQRSMAWDKVEKRIRDLEAKLNIPDDQRIFPAK